LESEPSAVTMMGRLDDRITSSITTTVVMVVAAIDPHAAWRQPILRLVDTAVGVAVGVAAGWISGPGFRLKPKQVVPVVREKMSA
jgi:uncharacterized membrane protein YccC